MLLDRTSFFNSSYSGPQTLSKEKVSIMIIILSDSYTEFTYKNTKLAPASLTCHWLRANKLSTGPEIAITKRTSRGQRGNLRALVGICEFHQSYFRRRKSVSWDVRIISWLITVKQSVALHLEVRFINESDFINKRKGFIVTKDNPDWEIDTSISLDLADSLDDISKFEQEFKSTKSDSVSGNFKFKCYTRWQRRQRLRWRNIGYKRKRKKHTAKYIQREGNDHRTQQSKQPTVNWPQ